MKTKNYAYYCPECEEEKNASWTTGTRNYSAQTLDVPYFVCVECRLIYLDKTAVREAISRWKKNLLTRKDVPSHKVLYKEMLEIAEKTVAYLCRTAGYKQARFKKIAR